MNKTRSPIIVLFGHADAGKTTLADKIRGTSVAARMEPGFLTQATGCSFIPLSFIENISGGLLDKFKIELKIPGLLVIDCPGHTAFMGMRKRGGNISDLAILVIDTTEGIQAQTDESLEILKSYKTPFLIAATKIDKIPGWFPQNTNSFTESLSAQSEDVRAEVEKKIYQLVSQLAGRGFNAERFDRIEDFTKNVAIVPVSGVTGEGLSELLMMVSGLAQQFLKDNLQLSERCKGTVLEVKELKGFGMTIDVIIYDGVLHKGDYLIIGGKEPIVTKIKALLQPKPLKDLRVEKQFDITHEVHAAAGIKIAAPDLDKVVSGSPIIVVEKEEEVEAAIKEVQKDIQQIEFSRDIEGIIVKADTLGALEAMIKLVGADGIPIRKAEVGAVNKQDIIEAQSPKDELKRVIFAFNVQTLPEAEELSKDLKIKIFSSDVIYHTVEEYKQWTYERKERELAEKLAAAMHPVKLKIIKGCVFHASKPCIVGIEVLAGVLKKGVQLKRADEPQGKPIGKVKNLESEGKQLDSAKTGDKIAISMEEPAVGKTIFEEDVLVSYLTQDDRRLLSEVREKLSEDEKTLLEEI